MSVMTKETGALPGGYVATIYASWTIIRDGRGRVVDRWRIRRADSLRLLALASAGVEDESVIGRRTRAKGATS